MKFAESPSPPFTFGARTGSKPKALAKLISQLLFCGRTRSTPASLKSHTGWKCRRACVSARFLRTVLIKNEPCFQKLFCDGPMRTPPHAEHHKSALKESRFKRWEQPRVQKYFEWEVTFKIRTRFMCWDDAFFCIDSCTLLKLNIFYNQRN